MLAVTRSVFSLSLLSGKLMAVSARLMDCRSLSTSMFLTSVPFGVSMCALRRRSTKSATPCVISTSAREARV